MRYKDRIRSSHPYEGQAPEGDTSELIPVFTGPDEYPEYPQDAGFRGRDETRTRWKKDRAESEWMRNPEAHKHADDDEHYEEEREGSEPAAMGLIIL